jgi:hypothetical protein
MHRKILLLLTLSAALIIPSTSGAQQRPGQANNSLLQTSAAPAHIYQVIIRVIQPVWRRTPTVGKQLEPQFTAILEDGFVLTDPLSDKQFLQTLNQANSTLRFDRVIRRISVPLQADSRYVFPGDVSIHDIWLAVVEKDRSLFRAQSASARNDSFSQPTKDTNKANRTTSSSQTARYKCGFKEDDLRRLYEQGKVVLSFNVKQFYFDGGKRTPQMTSDSCQIMGNGATVCLTRNLPVKIAPDGSASLMPADCIFVTVTRN